VNRDAAGLGSWLLRESSRVISADAEAGHVLDQTSFLRWQMETCAGEGDPAYSALFTLLREAWRDELDSRERAVLRGLHLDGKSESAIGREMGLHHSAVGRLRRRAEEKLREKLSYVLRYIKLVEGEPT
jgi:DNA-directed RNA polymerase specialized sigma24 family protein